MRPKQGVLALLLISVTAVISGCSSNNTKGMPNPLDSLKNLNEENQQSIEKVTSTSDDSKKNELKPDLSKPKETNDSPRSVNPPVQKQLSQKGLTKKEDKLNQEQKKSLKSPKPDLPKLDLKQLPNIPKLPNLPTLPELLEKPVEIQAPPSFKHPLVSSEKLYFMLGEDQKGNYLYAEGPVVEGAYDDFIKYVRHFESRGIHLDRFMMHSNGGLLNEGLKIGTYIHDNNWTTDADANIQCYSSCGMIYASGVNKRMQSGAKVGFHRPYYSNKPDTPELIIEVYQSYQPYWDYIQGNEKLYDRFMTYDRNEMYVLDADTINNYMQSEIY
ncbi:hypothetical protein VIOR3934_15271 [Vibrio orientalis CIP 102891 = ATCC 33934]|uniref:Lipoprotein n=1 Tax=Vibrio orientalis CIP 102891 = ATCC 33934 TaxID=675816 RepID=C9QE20_VIBOR|nr:hypothetical protein [Vibrio orientalis]EEX94160.1 hypothetical protein VIA_001318 [Vibrio orientalis CIP 102891 = ATCC 33934]EGU44524.1 hypothetical protein VIOR3934_15271 [Vibrio orientalis CIP 102891 = ATCC 33934]